MCYKNCEINLVVIRIELIGTISAVAVIRILIINFMTNIRLVFTSTSFM